MGFTALESGNNVEAQTRGQTPGKNRDESIQIFLIELRQPEPGCPIVTSFKTTRDKQIAPCLDTVQQQGTGSDAATRSLKVRDIQERHTTMMEKSACDTKFKYFSRFLMSLTFCGRTVDTLVTC